MKGLISILVLTLITATTANAAVALSDYKLFMHESGNNTVSKQRVQQWALEMQGKATDILLSPNGILLPVVIEALGPLMAELEAQGAEASEQTELQTAIKVSTGMMNKALQQLLVKYKDQIGMNGKKVSFMLIPWHESSAIGFQNEPFELPGGYTVNYLPQTFYKENALCLGQRINCDTVVKKVMSQQIDLRHRYLHSAPSSSSPVYPLGVILNIDMQQDKVSMRLEALLGLRSQRVNVQIDDDAAWIEDFVVPSAPVEEAALARIRVSQTSVEGESAKMFVEFGRLSDIGLELKGMSSFRVTTLNYPLGICHPTELALPHFDGYAKDPIGLGDLDAKFALHQMHISPVDLAITDLKMKFIPKSLPGCWDDISMVNDGFLSGINNNIQERLNAEPEPDSRIQGYISDIDAARATQRKSTERP
jgi:hypothetical protein